MKSESKPKQRAKRGDDLAMKTYRVVLENIGHLKDASLAERRRFIRKELGVTHELSDRRIDLALSLAGIRKKRCTGTIYQDRTRAVANAVLLIVEEIEEAIGLQDGHFGEASGARALLTAVRGGRPVSNYPTAPQENNEGQEKAQASEG